MKTLYLHLVKLFRIHYQTNRMSNFKCLEFHAFNLYISYISRIKKFTLSFNSYVFLSGQGTETDDTPDKYYYVNPCKNQNGTAKKKNNKLIKSIICSL